MLYFEDRSINTKHSNRQEVVVNNRNKYTNNDIFRADNDKPIEM